MYYPTTYTLDPGNSYLFPASASDPGNSDLIMGIPFPSVSFFSSLFIAVASVASVGLGDALLLDSRPKKNAAPRRRTPKGTPTPIAALSPVERPGEEEDKGIAGFEVALSTEGLPV